VTSDNRQELGRAFSADVVPRPGALVILLRCRKGDQQAEERTRCGDFLSTLEARKRSILPDDHLCLVGGKGPSHSPYEKRERDANTVNTYMIDGLPPGQLEILVAASIDPSPSGANQEIFRG